MEPIDINKRRRETGEVVVEHITAPTAEQRVAWDAFWASLIADLQPLVAQDMAAQSIAA